MDFNAPTDKNVRFKVSLSNGETFYEGKKPFDFIPGELSPIQRMLAYVEDNHVDIRSMSLYTKDGTEYNLPSAGKSPRFQAFALAAKPFDYAVYRKMGADMGPDSEPEHFTVAEAFYQTFSIQLWVSEKVPHHSYVLVLPKE